jgi:hypothetical protein
VKVLSKYLNRKTSEIKDRYLLKSFDWFSLPFVAFKGGF